MKIQKINIKMAIIFNAPSSFFNPNTKETILILKATTLKISAGNADALVSKSLAVKFE